MFNFLSDLVSNAFHSISSTTLQPGLHPIPGTKPLTIEAAICPPLLYYLALLFLPPAPPSSIDNRTVKLLRSLIALLAGFLFFRLPLAYHVPQSIGLTYQLGLVGLYGGCRVLDAFFISAVMFDHVPRRVYYKHTPRKESALTDEDKDWSDGGQKDPFTNKGHNDGKNSTTNGNATTNIDTKGLTRRLPNPYSPSKPTTVDKSHAPDIKSHPSQRRSSLLAPYFLLSNALAGPDPTPVYEDAQSEDGWPHGFSERASWALELELSMRGVGFTWTTADVRHTRKTWLPTVGNRIHSILVHVAPVLLISSTIIRRIYKTHLASEPDLFTPKLINGSTTEVFDANLTIPTQILLTACLGAFLMSAFSFAHSIFAIMLSPLAPSPLAFFPPLYTTRVWDLTSVRKFWSFGWHRLFARLFLVYGVWPGEWVERKLTGKRKDQPADIGKVLGGFLSSAFVHSFSVRGCLGGEWTAASGEAKFFALNGAAVVFEGAVQRLAKTVRRKMGWRERMWFDAWIGRVWWLAVLMWTGRNFARGWVKSGLVREMAFV